MPNLREELHRIYEELDEHRYQTYDVVWGDGGTKLKERREELHQRLDEILPQIEENERAFDTLMQEHEALTERIKRLVDRADRFGNREDRSFDVLALDKKRYQIHRELERIGAEIGISEAQIRLEMYAGRLGSEMSTRPPGTFFIPVPLEYHRADHLHMGERLPSNMRFYAGNAQVNYFGKDEDGEDEERDLQKIPEGVVMVYNIQNDWGGDVRPSFGFEYDLAFPLKAKRMSIFFEEWKEKNPETGIRKISWKDLHDGLYHSFNDTRVSAIYIPKNEVEEVLREIQEHRERYWLSEQEMPLLAQTLRFSVTRIFQNRSEFYGVNPGLLMRKFAAQLPVRDADWAAPSWDEKRGGFVNALLNGRAEVQSWVGIIRGSDGQELQKNELIVPARLYQKNPDEEQFVQNLLPYGTHREIEGLHLSEQAFVEDVLRGVKLREVAEKAERVQEEMESWKHAQQSRMEEADERRRKHAELMRSSGRRRLG